MGERDLSSMVYPLMHPQVSRNSSKPVVTQTVLITTHSSHKTKRHECGKGICREEEEGNGWEEDEGRAINAVYMPETVIEKKQNPSRKPHKS